MGSLSTLTQVTQLEVLEVNTLMPRRVDVR